MMMHKGVIATEGIAGDDVRKLLREHFEDMLKNSPKGSCHFLDFSKLEKENVTFFTMRTAGELMGCGALQTLDAKHGELKSMRTHLKHLRKGVGSRMLEHIIEYAKDQPLSKMKSEGRPISDWPKLSEVQPLSRLSLETGSSPTFEPALKLYERFAFKRCAPFGDYKLDPFSVFMTREI